MTPSNREARALIIFSGNLTVVNGTASLFCAIKYWASTKDFHPAYRMKLFYGALLKRTNNSGAKRRLTVVRHFDSKTFLNFCSSE